VFGEQSSLRWRINPMQPRGGGRIALRARSAGVLWYDLHLESGGDDAQRTRQLEQVLSDLSRGSRAELVVIAGDFNNAVAFQSFMFEGLRRVGLTDALGATGERQTSINHRHPIDWIFARGLRATAGRVERVEDASDHYPVVAVFAR
jgi:endonuclease/exonuclease/phosphatase (EEP) superfamily protein YafD